MNTELVTCTHIRCVRAPALSYCS